MANELRLYQNLLGGRLSAALPAAATVVTDGVSNSTTTITSATAAFNAATDVGAPVSGTDIPAGAYIASVTNSTTAVLSAAATGTGSARTWTISRHLVIQSAALAAAVAVASTQHLMAVLDPDGMAGEPEIVKVTKHDAVATWAQVTRAQEGGSIARAHAAGTDWIHGALASDLALPVSATVLTSESTTTTTYSAFGSGPAVDVMVPESGKILVAITADISADTLTTTRASFALSGANTQAASDNYSIRAERPANIVETQSALMPITGLTPGLTTVTVQVKCTGGNTATFAKRHLVVTPV